MWRCGLCTYFSSVSISFFQFLAAGTENYNRNKNHDWNRVLLRCDSNDLVIPMKFNGERTQIHREKNSIDSAGIVVRNPENDVCSKPIRAYNRLQLKNEMRTNESN